GIEIRCDVHTGEVEMPENGDMTGTAVNLEARVERAAEDGTIFVSSTCVICCSGGPPLRRPGRALAQGLRREVAPVRPGGRLNGRNWRSMSQSLRARAPVLGIRDVVSPLRLRSLALGDAFGDREMHHEMFGRGAVPVQLVRRRVDHVARAHVADG